jgi:AcrR family transcriptional regulator
MQMAKRTTVQAKASSAARPAGRTAAQKDSARPDDAPRARKAAARREAILNAALDEFSARGYAAARLDDIAERAGVAKGTIYLYFADKEALFQDIVRTMIVPVVTVVEHVPPPGVPIRVVLSGLIDVFVREVYGTRRGDVIRLMMNEGPRFPALAEFYYRNVIERALTAMRGLLQRAIASGELKDDTLLKFPQLLVTPVIFSIVWSGLFDRFAPVDVAAMMRAHLDFIFGKERFS